MASTDGFRHCQRQVACVDGVPAVLVVRLLGLTSYPSAGMLRLDVYPRSQ